MKRANLLLLFSFTAPYATTKKQPIFSGWFLGVALADTIKNHYEKSKSSLALFIYVGQGWPSVARAMDGRRATGTLCHYQETANLFRLVSWSGLGRFHQESS